MMDSDISSLSIEQLKNLTNIEEISNELKKIDRQELELVEKLDLILKNEETLKHLFIDSVQKNKQSISGLTKTTSNFHSQLAETVDLAYKVSNPVSKLASDQAQIKSALKLLKETQLLQTYFLKLQEAYEIKDYNACLEICHNYLNLDYNSVINSPFSKFLETSSSTSAKDAQNFEAIRSELVKKLQNLAQVAIGLMDENTYNQVIESVHQLPLVGEFRTGAKILALYFSKTVSFKYETLVQSEENDYREIIKNILEEASKSIVESMEILSKSYDRGWSLLCLSDFIGSVDHLLDSFQKDFRDKKLLSSRLEEIHSSFQSAHVINRSNIQTQSLLNSENGHNIGGKAELRELDLLLSEISFISQKVNLFRKLILGLAQEELDLLKQLDKSIKDPTKTLPLEEAELRFNGIKQGEGGVGTVVQPILDAFPIIEKFYFTRSVEKVLELDEYEEGNGHSSSVDDTFYLIKKGSFRSLTSCDLSIFKNSIVTYASGLKELLYSLTPVASLSEMAQNAPGSRNQKSSGSNSLRDRLVAINNASVSRKYLERLIKELKEAVDRTLGSAKFDSEIQKSFHNSIDLLNSSVTSFTERRQSALDVLLDKAVSPKVQAFFAQISTDCSYNNVDSSLVNQLSPIASKFASRFNNFLKPFKTHFIEENFTWLIQGIAKVSGESLVQMILSHRYDQMGVITLGEDIGVVTNYFTSIVDSYIKDCFSRPLAMLRLLESDSISEAVDLINKNPENDENLLNSGVKLTAKEVRTILSSRTDFSQEEVEEVNLSHLP